MVILSGALYKLIADTKCMSLRRNGEIMKLKYKKMILLTAMSTMGIGILTLSVSNDKTNANESMKSQVVEQQDSFDDDTVVETANLASALAIAVSPEPISIATPTPEPTPTPLPVYPIEQEGTYPEIDNLLKEFYTAKLKRDVDALNALLTDPDNGYTKEDLNSKMEYISEYRNVTTYVKKGYKEGTYIVLVYSEIKFTSIDTPAPGLAIFYVVTGEDGKPKVFSGKMDDETYKYYKERSNDEDVVAIIEMTNMKSDKALESDEYLKYFWNSIKEYDSNSENTEAQESNE